MNSNFIRVLLVLSGFVILACNTTKNDFDFKKLKQTENKMRQELVQEFDGIQLKDLKGEFNEFSNYLSKVIVVDSVINKSYRKNDNYFLNCRIDNTEFQLVLKCDESTFDEVQKFKNSSCLIAMKVTEINQFNEKLYLDSINTNENEYLVKEVINISGDCLSVVEKPSAFYSNEA